MKIPIWAFLLIALFMGFIGFCCGSVRGEDQPIKNIDYYLSLTREQVGLLSANQNPPDDVIYMLCQEIKRLSQAEKMYEQGLSAGKAEGFQEGYKICWVSCGMRWIDSHQRFLGFQEEYGNLHNTPWDKFTLEEKVVIAMYGGSGSKLGQDVVDEFIKKYGVK